MRELSINEKDLLARIEATPELEPFFFKKLKGLDWLYPLYKKGYFSPKNIPEPVSARQEGYMNIPYWPASIYLTTISTKFNDPVNQDSAQLVLDIIRQCTQHTKENEISNYKVWYQFAQVLANMPISLVNDSDISAIEYWLNDPYEQGIIAEEIGVKFLKKLINDGNTHQYALNLIKTLFSITFDEKETGSYKRLEVNLSLRGHSIEKIAKEIAPLIGSELQVDGLKLFEALLTDILDKTDRDTWSSLWRGAIEDHPQNHSRHDAEDILVTIFREAFLGLIDSNVEQSATYLKHILEGEYQTLKRIAIYVIGERCQTLHGLVPEVINEQFFNDTYRHEIWHFMNKNYNQLSPDEREPFSNYINSIVVKNDDGVTDERATAYKKAIWLSSIQDCSNELKKQYADLVEQAETEPKHPDFISYTSAGWVKDKSPIPLEDLQQMEIHDLIEAMDTTDEGDSFREGGRTGVIKAFRAVVKNNPEDILNNINLFINKDLAYSHQILEGFRELWKSEASLAWKNAWEVLLGFCQSLVSRHDFWSEKNALQRNSFIANRHWVVGSISELIEEGVRSDEHAFDIELLPQAFEIITTLLDKQKGEKFDISHDSVTTAINSPRGKCIEALINLALRSMRTCELTGKTKEDVWGEYAEIFTNELKKPDEGEFEFITLVANYLPNFLYMSNDWVLENLPLIFNKNNHQAWVSAFNGYSYVGTVYQNVYAFLRDNGHFAAALDDENLRSQVSDKVIQGAIVAFIHGFEQLDGDKGLLSLLISRNRYEELHQIIWFSWTQRKKDDVNLTAKILELWPRILEKIGFESSEGRKIASDLCDWIVFVEELTEETFRWLYQIAPYADENHNSREFLRSIHRLSENQPHKAQSLWLRMLEQYSYAYPEEEIKGALTNFLKLDRGNARREGLRLANEIVDAYIKQDQDRPSEWLKEILRNDS
jgi:hypothetical protein